MADASSPAHLPVLTGPILELAFPPHGRIFVDGTFGLGGHSRALLERFPTIERLLGIDRDADALRLSGETFSDPRVERIHACASAIPEILRERGIPGVDGILLDLGVSSFQLDTADRGFSFMRPGPLDMRMNRHSGTTAAEIVNTASERELADIFFRYGEERLSRRIAEAIVRRRATASLATTEELAELVSSVYPTRLRRESPIHPATRVFQALRIAVNEELDELRQALDGAIASLLPGGRIAVISFHSLEDRIVKQAFVSAFHPCTCPPKLAVCVCGRRPTLGPVTRKPVTAGLDETAANPRARSAKLRVAEKLP